MRFRGRENLILFGKVFLSHFHLGDSPQLSEVVEEEADEGEGGEEEEGNGDADNVPVADQVRPRAGVLLVSGDREVDTVGHLIIT